MADVRKGKLSDLTPDRRNANKGTKRGLGALDHSLRQYGAGRSILVDKHGNIIAGNKTAERAADIGLEDVIFVQTDGRQIVAVQRTDLDLDTDKAARELAYFDNRVGQLDLDWSADEMTLDIGAGIDLAPLFSEKELADLGVVVEEPKEDAGAQVDKAEELREKWQVEPGQLWQLGEHRLICGDCTDKATVERVMQGEKAAMGFFDPPYGISFQSNGRTASKQFDVLEGDNVINGEWIPLSVDYLRDNGALYICTRWDVYPQWLDLVTPHIKQKNLIVWDKVDWSSGDLEGDYSPRHEFILYCVKGRHILRGHRESNVWQFGAQNKQDYLHPTQKKVELPEFAIQKSSDAGDVVMDWFSGSGTVIVACERQSRKCYASEISPAYVAVTLQRYLDTTGITPILVGSNE